MTDKKFWQSKKAKMTFYGTLLIAGLLITALLTQVFGWSMAVFMSIGMLAICVMVMSFVVSQATLDRFLEKVTDITKLNVGQEAVTKKESEKTYKDYEDE